MRSLQVVVGLLGLLLLASCFALPERLDGPNYPASGPPYVAPDAARVPAAAGLPNEPALIHRVILIGDAGVPLESEPVLASLGVWGDAHADRTSVLFLGDNVYPNGIEEDAVAAGEAVLQAQIDATRARRIFIPGNHDWGHRATDRLLRQQAYIDGTDAEFWPRDTCPGPVAKTILPAGPETRGIRAIVFDIDPWYFGDESTVAACERKTPEELGSALAGLLDAHRGEWLFVGSHHPIETGGPHGGLSRGMLADAITGTMLLAFGTLQDTYEEGYRAIMAPIVTALRAAPPTFYVAGHDHNLQILNGNGLARLQVVSGAGSTQRVRDGYATAIPGTIFAHGHPGFVVVDIVRDDGGERARIHVVETGHSSPVFSMDLDAD